MATPDDDLPSYKDLWTPKHAAEDPVSVRQQMRHALAKLSLAQKAVHRNNKALKRMADAGQDHHGAEAEALAGEIRHLGVGNDPHLEDAHMAHLRERRNYEQSGIKLKGQIDNFVPKVP